MIKSICKILVFFSCIYCKSFATYNEQDWKNTWDSNKASINFDNLKVSDTELLNDTGDNKVQLYNLEKDNATPKAVTSNDVDKFESSVPKDEGSLKSKGERKSRDKEDDGVMLFHQLHKNTDETNPSAKRNIDQADKVIIQTEKLLGNLTNYVKGETGLDFNCVPIDGKSYLRDDPFVMGYDIEKVSEERYEQFFCEKPYREYDVHEDLEIHCLHFSRRKEDIKITSMSRFVNFNESNGIVTFRCKYEPKRYYNRLKEDPWFSKGAIDYKKIVTTYQIAEETININLNVKLDPEVLQEFSIMDFGYTGYVEITVNGNTVFSAPNSGGNLYSKGYHEERYVRTEKPFLGVGLIRKHEYYDDAPVISQGGTTYYLQGAHRDYKKVGNVDLRRYLRKGSNSIVIKGISCNSGTLDARVQSHERLCLKWSDPVWNEKTRLKN